MKKTTLLASSILIGMSLVSATAYSDDTATIMKDSVITTKVKAKLANEKAGTLANIHVDTDDKGVVLLSGTAHSAEEVAKATEIAKGTKGVTSVTSTVTVQAGN